MRIIYDIEDCWNMLLKVAPYINHMPTCSFGEQVEENEIGLPCNCGVAVIKKEARIFAENLLDQIGE
jgi:hypothetical protein